MATSTATRPAPRRAELMLDKSGLQVEACAWLPPQQAHRALACIMEYLAGTQPNGTRPTGQPEITGFRLLDDRGGTCMYQLRVEGLTAAQLKRIVGRDIDCSMEHA